MLRNLSTVTIKDIEKSEEKIMNFPLICLESDIERISDDLAKMHYQRKSNIYDWINGTFDNYNLDE